jgi:hypothetical protein
MLMQSKQSGEPVQVESSPLRTAESRGGGEKKSERSGTISDVQTTTFNHEMKPIRAILKP